jgi:uncharacterized protein YcnI
LFVTTPVVAHVTVTPADAPATTVQRYCIRVPSEKSIPTTALEIQFPDALEITETDAPPGWRVTAAKGRQGRIVGATWHGGRILPKQFLEFGVLARNPAAPAELTWKAIQTYQDGSEVHWIGPPRAQFPAAVTRVRAQRGQSPSPPSACARGVADAHK